MLSITSYDGDLNDRNGHGWDGPNRDQSCVLCLTECCICIAHYFMEEEKKRNVSGDDQSNAKDTKVYKGKKKKTNIHARAPKLPKKKTTLAFYVGLFY